MKCKPLFTIKILQTKFMRNYKTYLRTHLSFQITVSICLFFWRKRVYPYDFMHYLKNFNEKSLPGKK